MQNQTRNQRRTDITGERIARLGYRFNLYSHSTGWSAKCKSCGERAFAPGAICWAEAHDCTN